MTVSKKREAPQQVLRVKVRRRRVRESGRGTRMERSSRVTHGCHRSLKRDEKKLRRGEAYAPSGHHYMVISASPSRLVPVVRPLRVYSFSPFPPLSLSLSVFSFFSFLSQVSPFLSSIVMFLLFPSASSISSKD